MKDSCGTEPDIATQKADACAAVQDCSGYESLQQELAEFASMYDCNCSVTSCTGTVTLLPGVGSKSSCCKSWKTYRTESCNPDSSSTAVACAAVQDCAGYESLHLELCDVAQDNYCGCLSGDDCCVADSWWGPYTLCGVGNSTSCCRSYNAYKHDANDMLYAKPDVCVTLQDCASYPA